MKQHRIVQLASGLYAIEERISMWGFSPLGWQFVCYPDPDCSLLVVTFETIESARKYFFDPMKIEKIVEVFP